MELRICCDASIKLEGMSNVNNVDYNVEEYRINYDTLVGNIKISGQYIKDDVDAEYTFSEQVPFTVVFKNDNFSINDIKIEDFNYLQIINHGIDCNFNILIEYASDLEGKSENNKESKETEIVEEIPVVIEEEIPVVIEEEIPAVIEEEIPAVIEEETTGMNDELDNLEKFEIDTDLSEDDLKDSISEKYDNLLKSILEGRDDNFLDEDKVTFSSQEDKGLREFLGKLPESYSSYKVFYVTEESEIEKICRNEKVSIEKIYNDNRNNDFISKRRLIIK